MRIGFYIDRDVTCHLGIVLSSCPLTVPFFDYEQVPQSVDSRGDLFPLFETTGRGGIVQSLCIFTCALSNGPRDPDQVCEYAAKRKFAWILCAMMPQNVDFRGYQLPAFTRDFDILHWYLSNFRRVQPTGEGPQLWAARAGGRADGWRGAFSGFPGRLPARKFAPRAARPPPPAARPGRAERADGTGGTWVQKKCTLSGILVVKSRTKASFLVVLQCSPFCHGWGKLPRDLLLSYRDANRRARARRARK
eukprot:gene13171-biopygen18544